MEFYSPEGAVTSTEGDVAGAANVAPGRAGGGFGRRRKALACGRWGAHVWIE